MQRKKECSTAGRGKRKALAGKKNRRKKLLASLEVQVTAQAND
jgi:hypothetical protein